jgi:serine/threonine protein kinase
MISMSLNQYQITASIGAGGMGEVFRARDTRPNRDVVVKAFPKEIAFESGHERPLKLAPRPLAPALKFFNWNSRGAFFSIDQRLLPS